MTSYGRGQFLESLLFSLPPLSVKVNYYVYNRKTMGEIFIFAILEL